VARFGGGTYQGLLAALQPVTVKETKSSDLTAKHAVRLYNAIAFAMWQHEAIMNTHVVILWMTGRAIRRLSGKPGSALFWFRQCCGNGEKRGTFGVREFVAALRPP
jgi:hypothetical protein